MSSFRSRLSAMKWRFTQKDKDENVKLRTHNLLDGGELSVPDSEHNNFLKVCAECICDGEKLYIVEQRSHPGYYLFFDLDIFLFETLDDTKSNDLYLKLCKLIVATINELFDDTLQQFEINCSVANHKQTKKHQKDCYKYGVHITSPSIVVNKNKMLKVREAVVQKLQNNLEKQGPTSWDEDIDKVVYESSGFRMNFSRKGGRCKCTQKQRDMCEKCEGTGKVDEGRPYMPLFTMDNTYSYTLYQTNPEALTFDFVYDILKKTSIRTTQETNVHFNQTPPSWFEDTTLFKPPEGLIITPKKRKLTEGVDSVECKLENKIELSADDLHSFNKWFHSMCNKKQLPQQYKGIYVTRAFSFTNNNVRSNIIARIDSQYCMNIGREHATNTVYMLINTLTKRAVMKCYCRCETTEGRRSVIRGKTQMCKDFSSSSIDASELKLNISCEGPTRAIKPRILAMF